MVIKLIIAIAMIVGLMYYIIRSIRAAAVFRARSFIHNENEQMKSYFYQNLALAAFFITLLSIPFWLIGMTLLQGIVVCVSVLIALILTF